MNAVPQKTVEVEDCGDCPFGTDAYCYLDPDVLAHSGMPKELCRLRPESKDWVEVVVRIKRPGD